MEQLTRIKPIRNKIKALLGVKFVRLLKIGYSLLFSLIDVLLAPTTLFYALFFRKIRRRKFADMPVSKKILLAVGVLPIIDHYYEPMFNHKKHLRQPLRKIRNLPGIDFNINAQLEFISRFNYSEELLQIPLSNQGKDLLFCYLTGPFPPADAEFLYNVIRLLKPHKIVEIGSGHSTLMAANALKKNKLENKKYDCTHICVEPYENKWLDGLDVITIRKKVESCEMSLFKSLERNDILFIDSSHIIRPQGDVLFEYLEVLPSIQPGVLVHIHDVFTPYDYPEDWVFDGHYLWNEQYLLEALLTHNSTFEIIGSTNFLLHNHYEEFAKTHPVSKMLTENGKFVGAGSFWLKKK